MHNRTEQCTLLGNFLHFANFNFYNRLTLPVPMGGGGKKGIMEVGGNIYEFYPGAHYRKSIPLLCMGVLELTI